MTDTARTITLERTFAASLDEVWALWTTPEGLTAWWGPEGFRVTVEAMDLRPGGQLRYLMIAADPRMIAFMEQNGMPTATPTTITYDEVTPRHRLGWVNRVDFVPGVDAYETHTRVDFTAVAEGVQVVVTTGVMHDPTWTQRATAGWESELGKLERLLAAR